MNKPLVTVALAAYNVGEFVEDTLSCIENQTYKNIEILCVDDASTDDTFERLTHHGNLDPRYRIIKQGKNQGLSVSRNLAIEHAKGKYIIMVDGDDLYDPTMVEKAVALAEKENVDMVIWDYATFTNEDSIPQQKQEKSALTDINPHDKIALLRRPAFMHVRLQRLSKIRQMGIRFEPGLTKQDIPIHWRLVTTLDKISLLPEKLAFYRQQPNATSFRKDRSVFSLARVMDIAGEDLRKADIYDKYKKEYLRSRLSLLQGMYDFILPEYKEEALQMVRDRFDDEARKFLKTDGKLLTPRVRSFYGMLQGRLLPTIRYKGEMLIREIYRKYAR